MVFAALGQVSVTNLCIVKDFYSVTEHLSVKSSGCLANFAAVLSKIYNPATEISKCQVHSNVEKLSF